MAMIMPKRVFTLLVFFFFWEDNGLGLMVTITSFSGFDFFANAQELHRWFSGFLFPPYFSSSLWIPVLFSVLCLLSRSPLC